jgi:hypothetical protein
MKNLLEQVEKKKVYFTILAIIIFSFSLYQYSLIKDFKQIPACLYGCDLYNHVGKIYHLYDGGSFFRDGANPNVNPWVPSLHHAMVTVYGKILGFDVVFAYNSFTIIAGILCSIIIFYLFKVFFGKALYGLLGVLIFLTLFPVWKYTPFVGIVLMPLWYLVFYNFYKKRDVLSAVFVGIVFGIVSLSSSNGFMAVTVFVATAFFIMIYPELKLIKRKRLKESFSHLFKSYILPFTIITIIGMSFAMIYWYEPIFKYHMHMTNLQSEFDVPDLNNLNVFFSQTKNFIMTFFIFSDWYTSFFTIFSLLGLFFIFIMRKKESKTILQDFLFMSFMITLVGTFNYIILFPLLKLNLMTGWINYHLYTTLKIILMFFSLLLLINILEKKYPKYKQYFQYFLIILIICISIFGYMKMYQERIIKDNFLQNAYSPLDPARTEVQKWVRENTNVNDIFLTTNENGFALNGLTGRKMMTMRRSHASQFMDFNIIMADAAVILYGNNTELTKSLLKRYDVKYFYWDQYWFNSEFQFDDKGQLAGFFDPLVIFDTKENRDYLGRNNVKYIAKHWFIDPGVQYEGIRQYDLLFILPSQFNQTKPWSDTFEKFIIPVKDVAYQGQLFAKIYNINVN